jgi:hypothetical protein
MIAVLSGCTMDGVTTANSDSGNRNLPSLVVSNTPPPDVIYHRGSRDTVLAGDENAAAPYAAGFDNDHVETLVTRKVGELTRELSGEQRSVDGFRERLSALQSKSDGLASEYYALVASINTELQAGSTAGNPVLTERWNQAQTKLEALSQGTGKLNTLATDVANEASKAAYLQESVRATYGLSGAVADDHKKLQKLEDDVNQNIVAINRLLTSVNDEINRRSSYLNAERLNMQTLSLAVANGELYGQNVSNSLYRKAAEDGQEIFKGNSVPSARRPLVIIRFDRPNVDFQQPVYTAVSQALEKYPAAKFDLVAVSPAEGNPAKLALASTEARKNGENVLRALTQMGLPVERVRLNAANSKDVTNSEVHLYIQ